MINVSKKLLALVMAMLMIFSGMVVASAEGTDTEPETEPVVEVDVSSSIANIALTLDVENKALTTNVKANGTVSYEGKSYALKTEISPSTGVFTSYTADGCYVFSQLAYGTNYTVTVSVVDDATDNLLVKGSKANSKKLLQSQNPPSTPVPSVVTSSSITVIAVKDCKYTLRELDGGKVIYEWTTAKSSEAILFDGLDAETWYVVAAKKGATTTHYESAEATANIKTKKVGAAKAAAPVLLDKTNTSIKVASLVNVEFSLDGKNWQSSNEFTGLKANTQYTIYARVKFTADQDPSEISEALVVTTNKGANFEASDKKLSFKVEGDNYAGKEIKFTVAGDGPANMNDVVYGDTRIVPIAYTVKFGDTTIKEVVVFDNPALVSQKGSFVPAEDYAEKIVNVNVIFRVEEYKGKNTDGSANWVVTKSFDKTFDHKVGKPDNAATKATGIFETIANFLFNTVPSFLAKAMSSDVWKKLFDALGDLGQVLG